MKFTLTITDATKEEIAAFLTGSSAFALNPAGDGFLTGIVNRTPGSNTTTPATSSVPMPQNGGDDEGPANANAPAVDAAGLPWDDRIHSKNKAMNADGTWRKRRNVDGNLVVSVEAELRQRVAHQQTQQPTMPPSPQMMQQPVMQPQMTQQQQPMMQMPQTQQHVPPMPDQTQQPVMQPQMQQQPVMQQPGPMDFNAFMTHLAGQMAKRDQSGAPLITTDYLAGVAQFLSQQFGRPFNSITDIAGDANVIAAAVNKITIDGRWS